MVHRGQVIADESLRVEFTATAADTDGALHEMRATYAPGSPFPPAHFHPGQEERFVVEEGELLFDIDGVQRVVAAGQQTTVPRGAVHRVRNPAAVPAVACWQTRPALRTGEFLEQVAAARASGGLLDLAAVVDVFGDVYQLAVRPRPVGAAAVGLLARIARVRHGGRRRAPRRRA
jgi:mannose-6-phosphate isomerase-like protein (cupin superfamily)